MGDEPGVRFLGAMENNDTLRSWCSSCCATTGLAAQLLHLEDPPIGNGTTSTSWRSSTGHARAATSSASWGARRRCWPGAVLPTAPPRAQVSDLLLPGLAIAQIAATLCNPEQRYVGRRGAGDGEARALEVGPPGLATDASLGPRRSRHLTSSGQRHSSLRRGAHARARVATSSSRRRASDGCRAVPDTWPDAGLRRRRRLSTCCSGGGVARARPTRGRAALSVACSKLARRITAFRAS